MVKIIVIAAAILSFFSPARASPAAPARAEVIESGQQQDGSYLAGVRITLAPGWMTYWRHPGEGGLPPVVKTEGSENLKSLQIFFPAPRLYNKAGSRSLGYDNEVVFPIMLVPHDKTQPLHLKLQFDYAVCSTLCLPQQALLSSVLQKETNSAARQTLLLAKMRVPQSQDNMIAPAKIDHFDGVFRVSLPITSARHFQFAVLETEKGGAAFISQSMSKDLAVFDMKVLPADKSRLRVTFIGETDAYVTTTVFALPAHYKN